MIMSVCYIMSVYNRIIMPKFDETRLQLLQVGVSLLATVVGIVVLATLLLTVGIIVTLEVINEAIALYGIDREGGVYSINSMY